MTIDIITLFPDMFAGPFAMSMVQKAQDKNLATINFIDLREFGIGPRRQVDDTPYGGGDGMVLRPEPVFAAVDFVKSKFESSKKTKPNSQFSILNSKVILLTPQGQTYNQAMAQQLSIEDHLILICGHYEGFDERIRGLADYQISVGNYILTGGEIPAMAVVDSVIRLIPGVLGGENSASDESFSDGKTLEYPHYTRPEEFKGLKVPDVLLSGHHGKIAKWRQQQALDKTNKRKS